MAAKTCRVFAHFLPKFDNQSEGARLSTGPAAAAAAQCLAVSKKHSGHLVMAPPFYSKNGTANLYSRLGEVLLRAHFRAVWPEDEHVFGRWWAHAAEHSLCYSFECVAPRIAGDHGATPCAAYMAPARVGRERHEDTRRIVTARFIRRRGTLGAHSARGGRERRRAIAAPRVRAARRTERPAPI